MISGFLFLVFLVSPLFVWTVAEMRLAWLTFSVHTCLLSVTLFVESDISEGFDVDLSACLWAISISNILLLAPLFTECLESPAETFGVVAWLLLPLIPRLEYSDVLSRACTVKWFSVPVADFCDPCLLSPGRRSFDSDTSRLFMLLDSLFQIMLGGI